MVGDEEVLLEAAGEGQGKYGLIYYMNSMSQNSIFFSFQGPLPPHQGESLQGLLPLHRLCGGGRGGSARREKEGTGGRGEAAAREAAERGAARSGAAGVS